MSCKNPREIAARLLLRRDSAGEYIERRLEEELAARPLSPADRALCQELVFGIVRRQRSLDWLIARKTEGRTQNSTIRVLLQLGLYQLFFLDRIPDHAAVNETVELGRRLGFGHRAGFLNAILRAYIREREQTKAALEALKTSDPALAYSHPAWLVERWHSRWGAGPTAQLLDWNNRPPPIFARLNELKTDADRLTARWREEGIEFEERQWDWTSPRLVFELLRHPPFADCGSFRDGWFYIQDASTLLAPRILDPQPGESILDLCAAPGGKSTFIAQLVGNSGRVVACDNQPGRLKLLEENCRRLGANVEISPAPASGEFDAILVDAPCSNTGVLRRRIELRWRIEPAEIERLRRAQIAMLASAAPLLKSGGRLVYSTCSIEPEENEQVVNEFLAAHPAFRLETQRQLLPFIDRLDGAFTARLSKT